MKTVAWIEYILCMKCGTCGHVAFNYGSEVPEEYVCSDCGDTTQVKDKTGDK